MVMLPFGLAPHCACVVVNVIGGTEAALLTVIVSVE